MIETFTVLLSVSMLDPEKFVGTIGGDSVREKIN